MKVLQAGPESVHVQRYCEAYAKRYGAFVFAGEQGPIPTGASAHVLAPFRGNPLHWISSYQKLKRFVREQGPDVIHIHQVNRFAWVMSRIARSLNIPVITTAWGSDVLLVPKRSALHKALTTAVLRASAIVTGDSRQMLEAIRQLVPEHPRLEYLQYGIDAVAAAAKTPIVYSNRLHKPLYRIDVVIRLFARFVADHPEWKLVIGAIGEETENLKALAASLLQPAQYEFVGWLDADTNAAWYGRSTIYISIPESDGTAVSLLEAMSAGCIPVVPDLEVSREWITDGKNGVIYHGQETVLEEALQLDRESCTTFNAQLVAAQALRSATLQRFHELYHRLGA